MELVVFDLDGTLLNGNSVVSPRTAETLRLLTERGIAYTVATGRMRQGSRQLLAAHGFQLPQIFKNGVMTWCPRAGDYSHVSLLTPGEILHVMHAVDAQGITPFVFTLQPDGRQGLYHSGTRNAVEERLLGYFTGHAEVVVRPVGELPADAAITNISALGAAAQVAAVERLVENEPHLVAFAGTAIEGDHLVWIDIHHGEASKGPAVTRLREELGATRVICFGDGDNDLSMFLMADECYAPDNAKPEIKAVATAVIGHHHDDGVAEFLRERFGL